MAGRFSVRLKTNGNMTKALRHDFRQDIPSHIDAESCDKNVLLYGGDYDESLATYQQQRDDIIAAYNSEKERQRELIRNSGFDEEREKKELRKVRNWRSDQKTHLMGVVTFSDEANAQNKSGEISREDLDRAAMGAVRDLVEKNNAELLYVIRHEDEFSPHFHFVMTNVNQETKMTHQFKRGDLSRVQDIAAESFIGTGIQRGERRLEKQERVAREMGVPVNSPEARKAANLSNKKVKELHATLLVDAYEAQEKRKELMKEISKLEEKREKNERLFQNKKAQYDELMESGRTATEKFRKVEKALGTYEKRLDKAHDDLEQKNKSLEALEDKILRLDGVGRNFDAENLVKSNVAKQSYKADLTNDEAYQERFAKEKSSWVPFVTNIEFENERRAKEQDVVLVEDVKKLVEIAYQAGLEEGQKVSLTKKNNEVREAKEALEKEREENQRVRQTMSGRIDELEKFKKAALRYGSKLEDRLGIKDGSFHQAVSKIEQRKAKANQNREQSYEMTM